MKSMTAKQKAFVRHYVRLRNGAESARRAGYSKPTAAQAAWDLLNDPRYEHVQEAVKAKLADRAERENEEHELLRSFLIGAIKTDPARLFGKSLNEIDPEDRQFIQSISSQEYETKGSQKGGSSNMKLVSKMDAAKMLAQSNGFLETKINLNVETSYLDAEKSLESAIDSLARANEFLPEEPDD